MSRYVGRLAPSPTGALHLGNVRTFMVAWLRARSQGGRVIMRTEDLDHPKDKPGAAAQAIEDLRWLGFDWDEEYVQSERKPIYRAALDFLRNPPSRLPAFAPSRPLVYPCVCSRKDVEAAQSAPHAGEQLYYPGTCRGRFATWQEAYSFKNAAHAPPPTHQFGQPPATSHQPPVTNHQPLTTFPPSLPCWRFRVPEGTVVEFDDAFAGHYAQDVSKTLGDFPIARDEFGAGYTLACTVDDLLMGVTEVVRGDDLLAATPAQILLARALEPWAGDFKCGDAGGGGMKRDYPRTLSHSQPLNFPTSQPLSYLHVPLVVGKDGKRLAKRHGDTRVASYRAAGKRPEELLGFLAASCGWARRGERVSLADLLPRFDLSTIPPVPFMI